MTNPNLSIAAAETAPAENDRFTPLFNDAFLKIFGSADSEPVTKPLVNAILRSVGIPEIDQIEHISADASLPGGVECKSPRLDIVMLCDDGRLVDLEAQRQKVDIGNKSLFYASKLLVENTPKDSDGSYSKIPEIVAVILLEDYKAFPDDSAIISTCRMRWDVGGRDVDGPSAITLVVAELEKVRERYNSANIEEVLADESIAWLYLLSVGYKNQEEMSAVADHFPSMEEFAKRYGIAIGDPDLKRAYDRYWESIMEYNSIVETAKKDGFAEGLEEGRAKGREAMAAKLIELGVDGSLIEEALAETADSEQ